MAAATTRRTATKTSVYCFCILVGSLFVGSIIMKAFGISYGAMRVAGGMIIGLLGHGMLYGKAEVSEVAKAQYANPAFFPLALPGITGPGSIAVVIGLETQIRELGGFQHRIGAYAAVLIAMLMVCAIEWLLLRSARSVTTRLGNTGIEVVTRLSGFLLICVGVQFVASGAQTLYATLVQAAAGGLCACWRGGGDIVRLRLLLCLLRRSLGGGLSGWLVLSGGRFGASGLRGLHGSVGDGGSGLAD